jgi:ATP-dependent DNA helicase RecQ
LYGKQNADLRIGYRHPILEYAVVDDLIAKARTLFRAHWKHPDFKPAQLDVLRAIYDDSRPDVLAILPTGFGKSAVYQVPAAVDGRRCAIVLSPLIALMRDQCHDLVERGIPATFVNSHVEPDLVSRRFTDMVAGKVRLIYVAPERIRNHEFLRAVACADISYLVVDEVHSVSRWGKTFRPAYQRIHELTRLLEKQDRRPQIIALTATATPDIESDVVVGVGLRPGYRRIVADPIRPNISYDCIPCDKSAFPAIRRIVGGWTRPGRYLIYCGTRKGCEVVAQIVGEVVGKHRVGFYHAGMPRIDTVSTGGGAARLLQGRTQVQDDFKAGRIPIIVATNAFGMGIDVPDIRDVIHVGIPGSVEDYVQETGRVGRDGLPARAILLHDDYSVRLRRLFLDCENPPYDTYRRLWAWLHHNVPKGQILKMSAAGIAQEVSKAATQEEGRSVEVRGVDTALSTMEAYGLVRRPPSAGGITVTLRVQALRECAGKPMPSAKGRLAALLASELAVVGSQCPPLVERVVEKDEVAELLGVTRVTVTKALASLQMNGVLTVSPAFYGKCTEIRQYGADLDAALPVDQLLRKRRREEERLEAMLRYACVTDRVGYIRNYFLGGGEMEAP